MMKKRILTIIAVMMMAVTPAIAQIFLGDEDTDNDRSTSSSVGVMIPTQNIEYDQYVYVPVGEGLMLLTGMGVVYLLGKRKKNG